MHDLLKDEGFLSLVKYLFDHPVTDPAWYWEYPNPVPAGVGWPYSSESQLKFVANLFSNCQELLRPYSNAQLKQGLWHFIDPGGWDFLQVTLDEHASPELKRQCVDSICVVYEKLFLPRCSSHLSHIVEPGVDPLNGICYMWWDICPRTLEERDGQFIPVMERALTLDSPACQESALHGLAHWHDEFPDLTQRVIDRFLGGHSNLRPELHEYALRAREGDVL